MKNSWCLTHELILILMEDFTLTRTEKKHTNGTENRECEILVCH